MDLSHVPEYSHAVDVFARVVPMTTRRTLYHYTSIHAAAAIVTSGTLWATDVTYLNDPTEQTYAHAIITQIIAEEAATANEPVRSLISGFSEILSRAQAEFTIYFTSFSEKPDLLSQWVAYTPSGRGLALGFDGRRVIRPKFSLRRVLYARKRQVELVREVVRTFRAGFDRAHVAVDRPLETQLFIGLGWMLQNMMICFKDPAYAAEAEWRLFHLAPPDTPSSFPILHRPTSSAVVPYVMVPMKTRDDSVAFIKDVVVGPGLDFAHVERGLRSLLAARVLPDVRIRPSMIPFRDPR